MTPSLLGQKRMEGEAQRRHRQPRVLRPERCVAQRRATAGPEQSLRLGRFPFHLSCEPMTGRWVEEQSEQAAVPEKQRMTWNPAILAEAPRPYSEGRVHCDSDLHAPHPAAEVPTSYSTVVCV